MEALGAEPGRIRAAIGPTISQRAYEVGPDLMDEVLAEDPEAARFFAGGQGDRMQFDLPGYGLLRLRRAGRRGRMDPPLHLFGPRAGSSRTAGRSMRARPTTAG